MRTVHLRASKSVEQSMTLIEEEGSSTSLEQEIMESIETDDL